MSDKHYPEEWGNPKRLTCVCGNELPCPSELPAPAGSVIAWRSCAQWPDGILRFSYEGHNNTTRDRHGSREQAEGVCTLLHRDGLGGERIHFPVRTWVEPIHSPNDPDQRPGRQPKM